MLFAAIEGIVEASPLPLDQVSSIITLFALILLYLRERSHDKKQDEKALNTALKINAIETAVKCMFACFIGEEGKAAVAKVALAEIDRVNPGLSKSVLVEYIRDWATKTAGVSSS
jgi:hypothetical protein